MSCKQNDIWSENLQEVRLEKAYFDFHVAMNNAIREMRHAQEILNDLRSSSSEEKEVTGSDPSGLTGGANLSLKKGENI